MSHLAMERFEPKLQMRLVSGVGPRIQLPGYAAIFIDQK